MATRHPVNTMASKTTAKLVQRAGKKLGGVMERDPGNRRPTFFSTLRTAYFGKGWFRPRGVGRDSVEP
jgi:hypothetical protein